MPEPNCSDKPKTQIDLARQLNIDQDTLINYKKLNELILELQSLIETGHRKIMNHSFSDTVVD